MRRTAKMRLLRRAALCGLSALALGACTVGPRFSAPAADVPSGWLGAKTGAVTAAEPGDAAWWTVFGDAELSSLVDRATGANLNARQAVLRIDEARAQRQIAGAGAWPQISANAAYDNTRISERTATTSLLGALGGARGAAPGGVAASLPGLSNPFDTYQYGLSGSWELDLFGRVRRTAEAADATTAAAVEDRRAVLVALEAEVAAVYVDLRGAQASRALMLDSIGTARASLRLAQDARQAGLASDLDITAAAAALAQAQALLPPLEAQATADRDELTQLLTLRPGALDGELQGTGAVPPLPAEVPAGLPADLARRRPDIRRAEARLHAAVALQGAAVAALFPRVSLGVSGGYEASRPAALTDWAARFLSAGPQIELPVFDGGQRRGAIRLQDARAKEAALAYAQTVLGALHDVEDAISVYRQEQARRGALDASARQGAAALELAQRRHAEGSASFREVLQAQARLQQAQIALVQSTAGAARDLIGLYRALGGGWQADTAAAG